MLYIDKQGQVIEAIQWDGSEESKEAIEKKFGIKITKYHGLEGALGTWTSAFYIDENGDKYCLGDFYEEDYIYFDLFQKPQSLAKEDFEHYFTPITDARVALAEQFKKDMLVELQKKQFKGDEWLKYSWGDLKDMLKEEHEEVEAEIRKFYFRIGNRKPNPANTIMEAAHLAIVCAFAAAKARKEELEEIWESKEKDD